MSDSPFIHEDQGTATTAKHCPLLKASCLGEQCQWWVMDFMEDRQRPRFDCAVSMIAKGLTDEVLLNPRHR